MISWLKTLFSKEPSYHLRPLNHPNELRTGDIVRFAFSDVQECSGKQFEVRQVNTYLYGDMCYPELVIKDRDNTLLYLAVEDEDGDEWLAVSKKIGKTDLLKVLSQEALDAIQNKGIGQKVTFSNTLTELEGWVTQEYQEVDELKGSFLKGDARVLSDAQIKNREHFTSYLLESADEEYALELEVYTSGEIELCATRYFDLDDIEEMWPAHSEATP